MALSINAAVSDKGVSLAIAEGIGRVQADRIFIGLAGLLMVRTWKEAGCAVVEEAFADRTYEESGHLRPHSFSDVVIKGPVIATRQALLIIRE